jgi:putative tryptophan/tyrosine transport system substrate-binding protein
MRRRDFIKVVAGLAITWPHAARAQQSTMPVIGFLDSGSPEGMTANLAAFHQGLLETGYIEGQNVAVEYRWAQSHFDQLPALAIELVHRKVAVIAATRGPLPARAAKAATSTIPVVFQSGSDPVRDGLVASLNRPGANVTGASRLSTDLIPKRLGLMTEVVPKLTKIALLLNPISPQADLEVQEMQEPTRSLGLQLFIAKASAADELDEAFATVKESGSGALIVAVDPLFVSRREKIVALGLQNAIPISFAERESVIAGGLMSYAASFSDSFRQVGVYVGRILKGASPADLPVQQPVKFDLIINLKTAKTLGLTVPQTLLVAADEVIE